MGGIRLRDGRSNRNSSTHNVVPSSADFNLYDDQFGLHGNACREQDDATSRPNIELIDHGIPTRRRTAVEATETREARRLLWIR